MLEFCKSEDSPSLLLAISKAKHSKSLSKTPKSKITQTLEKSPNSRLNAQD